MLRAKFSFSLLSPGKSFFSNSPEEPRITGLSTRASGTRRHGLPKPGSHPDPDGHGGSPTEREQR